MRFRHGGCGFWQRRRSKRGSSDVLYMKAKACFQTWQHRGAPGNEADVHTVGAGPDVRRSSRGCLWSSQRKAQDGTTQSHSGVEDADFTNEASKRVLEMLRTFFYDFCFQTLRCRIEAQLGQTMNQIQIVLDSYSKSKELFFREKHER